MAERHISTERKILTLALPALGALIAEPLFLLADSAIVGRLGTTQLAGLGLAGAILATGVNVFIFLAYGTTSSVARRIGAGDRDGAIAVGLDAAWLAAGIGLAVAVIGWLSASLLVTLFGADGEVSSQAVTYLRWSLPGVPAMLVVLALVGVLRGLQNTRVTLGLAVVGAVVNALLNLLLVHGLGWGIKVRRSARCSPSSGWPRWPPESSFGPDGGRVYGCAHTWTASGWWAGPASRC